MSFKRNLLTTILLTGLSLWAGCSSNYSNNKLYSARWERANLNKPQNLEEIRDYLNLNIILELDFIDKWNSAEKTIRLGSGDCEDIATVGSYFAEFLDYPPKVLILSENFLEGHAITLLEKKDSEKIRYGAIDPLYLIPVEHDSILNLINHINRTKQKNYTHYKIIKLNSLKKNWINGKGDICPLRLKGFGFNSVEEEKK